MRATRRRAISATGNGRVQFPLGTQHVLRQVGTTLILYSWLPAASSDPTAGNVADALNTLGIGFTVPELTAADRQTGGDRT